jgi:hypothetical protein
MLEVHYTWLSSIRSAVYHMAERKAAASYLYQMPVAGRLHNLVGDVAAGAPEEDDLFRTPVDHVEERLQSHARVALNTQKY